MTIDQLIEEAIKEDIGDGDHTSLAIFSGNVVGLAQLKIKDTGILAGVSLAERIFHKIDPTLHFRRFLDDGAAVKPGDVAFEVEGNILSILTSERLVLNFMQRLSGVATETNRIVTAISGLKTKILDTRKTTPNLRELEKYAVTVGGGYNHRMGLYDMVMIKDNHVDFAGGVEKAIDAVHAYLTATKRALKIEIEVRNLDELKRVLVHGQVDRVMFDNFTPSVMKEAVEMVHGRFETEASGGITLDDVRAYAETGVDFISIGAVTHRFRSLDMSLKAIKKAL